MIHPDDLLSAHLDGELTPEEVRRVEEHLAGCAPCRAELEALAAARSAVRGLPILEVPPGVLGLPDEVVVPLRRRTLAWIGAAAAAVVAGLVGLATLLTPPEQVVTPTDLSRLFAARSSADPMFTPAKVAVVADMGERGR